MRKFLMVAAVVAVAACGKKQADTSAEAAGAAVDTMAHQADSAMGAMADTSKTALQKAADAMSAPADSVNKKMEKDPAKPPVN